ncbi:MAG: Haloacid dehalogenase [Devosia sp.]|nr:Haloacid dehalogenase [Devosia sp.]
MPTTLPTAPLKPFSAIVFDMDGTLLDTEMVFKEIVWDVSADLGFEMTDLIHHAMVGSSHETTNKLLVEAYGVSFPYTIFDEKCRTLMRERMEDVVPVKPGVHELLAELKARRIPAAVATSSRAPHALGHLGGAGILSMFEAVVTRDDVINPKPHPEPYLMAARRLGIEPELCIAVEDSHTGVRAAHAAGLQTIMVPDLVRPSDEIRALCIAVMDSLHDLRHAAFAAA